LNLNKPLSKGSILGNGVCVAKKLLSPSFPTKGSKTLFNPKIRLEERVPKANSHPNLNQSKPQKPSFKTPYLLRSKKGNIEEAKATDKDLACDQEPLLQYEEGALISRQKHKLRRKLERESNLQSIGSLELVRSILQRSNDNSLSKL